MITGASDLWRGGWLAISLAWVSVGDFMQAPQRAARRVMRFGVFEVDLHARELRKRGIKIGLQQQPLRVLALLLEHAGEVVTREDLRQAIWPAGTFVEFDVGLDAAIHKLRAALDDSADSPRVSHILEGGFQRVGSRLRLQVRLVDARDGSTRWSATYDREMKDVFETQDELAGAVARELEVRLEGRAGSNPLRHRTRNIEAYELYLRGHDLTLHFTDSGLRAGLEYFNQAIALDSTFAAAYAAAARGYALLGWSGNPGFSLGELRTRAEAAVRKALALDDSLAEAHAALGVILMLWRGDPTSAEAEARRALALNPAEPRVHE